MFVIIILQPFPVFLPLIGLVSVGKLRNFFVTGCKNFQLSTVVDHENSKGHKDSCAKQTAEQNLPKKPAYNSLLSLNEHKRKQLEYKFRNIHAVRTVLKNMAEKDRDSIMI
jgi:hypothetical protein